MQNMINETQTPPSGPKDGTIKCPICGEDTFIPLQRLNCTRFGEVHNPAPPPLRRCAHCKYIYDPGVDPHDAPDA
jgi:hypothetical protein